MQTRVISATMLALRVTSDGGWRPASPVSREAFDRDDGFVTRNKG